MSKNVSNICQYKCKDCGKFYETSGSLKEHLRHSHEIYAPGILVYESLVKIVVHKCLVCSENSLCDKLLLKRHMKRHNRLSLEKYKEIYNVKEIFPKKPKRTIQTWLQELTKLQTTNCKISLTVGNLCKYSCNLCEFTSKVWPNMREHVSATHHTQASSLSEHIINANFYKCKLCSEILLCDSAFISWHLKNKHNENLTTYKKKAMVPVAKNIKEEYLLKLEAVISNIPKIPAKSSCVLKSGSLSDNLLTGDVGDLSLFQCLSCHELLLSYTALHDHRKLCNHKPKGIHSRSESIVVARYHKCHI